jgi:hypothetical protein
MCLASRGWRDPPPWPSPTRGEGIRPVLVAVGLIQRSAGRRRCERCSDACSRHSRETSLGEEMVLPKSKPRKFPPPLWGRVREGGRADLSESRGVRSSARSGRPLSLLLRKTTADPSCRLVFLGVLRAQIAEPRWFDRAPPHLVDRRSGIGFRKNRTRLIRQQLVSADP